MTREQLVAAMVGINKFMYYSWNFESVRYVAGVLDDDEEIIRYVPRMILEAKWSCNIQHMVSKWLSCVDKCSDPHTYFSRFYGDLDSTNRQAMIEWIMENYNSEIKIDVEDELA